MNKEQWLKKYLDRFDSKRQPTFDKLQKHFTNIDLERLRKAKKADERQQQENFDMQMMQQHVLLAIMANNNF